MVVLWIVLVEQTQYALGEGQGQWLWRLVDCVEFEDLGCWFLNLWRIQSHPEV